MKNYPHSRYVQRGGKVKRGMWLGREAAFLNILTLFWPRFPTERPYRDDPRTLTAKKWRRVRYWIRHLPK